MRAKVAKSVALHALRHIAPFRARLSKPVLECVKLSAEGDILQLEMTDLEDWCQIRTGAEVDEPGVALVPLGTLTSAVQEMDGLIELSTRETTLLLTDESSEIELATWDPAEYPSMPEITETLCLAIHGLDLRRLIDSVWYACEPASGSVTCSGILLEHDGAWLRAVATDGRRMAIARVPAGSDASEQWTSVIVHGQGLHRLSKLLAAQPTELAITRTTVFIVAACPAYTVWVRRLEGRYVEWQRIVPTSQPIAMFNVPFEDLAAAIRRAAVVLREPAEPVRLELTAGCLAISAESPIGKTWVTLPVNVMHGQDAVVWIRPRFLLDALRPLSAGIQVSIYGPRQPVVLQTESYQSLIMPVAREESTT